PLPACGAGRRGDRPCPLNVLHTAFAAPNPARQCHLNVASQCGNAVSGFRRRAAQATNPWPPVPITCGIMLATGGNPMRAQFLALTFIAATAASSAFAQQAAPPVQTFLNNKKIMALVDKAKADRKGEAPLVAEPILLLAPYRAMLEYRPATAPAALHEKDAELMVVLDGAGNIVTGGKIVDEK